MTPEQRKLWLPLAVLAAALVVWAGLLALGAYLQWGADQPVRDLRRAVVVLGAMGLFLVVWGVALWLRWRRGPRPPRFNGPRERRR